MLLVLALMPAGCKGGSEPKPAEEDKGLPMKEVGDPEYGYTVQVPEEAVQTEKEDFRHVWAYVYNQQVDSYTVIVQSEPGVATQDEARARVAMVREEGRIESVETLEDGGFRVTMKPDELVHYGEIWVFRRGAERALLAICSGPEKGPTLATMCNSLRVTR